MIWRGKKIFCDCLHGAHCVSGRQAMHNRMSSGATGSVVVALSLMLVLLHIGGQRQRGQQLPSHLKLIELPGFRRTQVQLA